MVSRDRISEHSKHARACDRANTGRRERHSIEERRILDVGRRRVPGVEIAFGHRKAAPVVVPVKDVRVLCLEHLRLHRAENLVFHFFRRWPDVTEKDGAAVANADGLGIEVDVHPPSERVRDDERR